MGRYDDEDREKLSWREIDQRSDRSRHVSGERKSFKDRGLKSDWARKQHLREAEKFFQGKKGTAAYKEAYTAIHDKYGTPGFEEAVKKFILQFGLPDDWRTLLLLLDAKDPAWAKEALGAMRGLYPQRSLIEQKGFRGKLKVLALTTKDKNLRIEAEKILEEL